MPRFFRMYGESIFDLGDVERLGFPITDGYQIPDEYIESGNFLIMRLCNGFGDWGIISALPRKLKEKYPNCKVYVPSVTLIKKIFGDSHQWKHWPNPELNCERVFVNNPYVDGFVDTIDEVDVFHDHYRVYDPNNENVSLVKQMMLFWGFSDSECVDYLPELYFDKDEIEHGDSLIKEYFGDSEFGGFIATSSQLSNGKFFDDYRNKLIIDELKKHNLKYVYYGGVDIKDTPFADYVQVGLDFAKVTTPLRVQLYIRSKAKTNIGYQSSIHELICRYSPIVCTEMDGGPRENYFDNITYLK
jgi:hypothetical protein